MFKIFFMTVLIGSGVVKAQSIEHEVIIPNNVLQIGGTLIASDSKSPLVIMLSGSGAQDRDETILGFKPFKIIADSLIEAGISTFRLDDRGVGQSTGNLGASTIDDLTSDVQAIMDYFETSEYGYSEFILLGHSQGGMVATSTAKVDERVTGVILWAAPTVELKDVISDQIRAIQLALGKTEADLVSTLEFQEKAYEAVRTGEGWDSLRTDFKKLIEAELEKLPPAQRAYINDVDAFANAQFEAQVRGINSPNMKSFLFYNSMQDLARTNIPSLAIYGGKDIQVSETLNASAYEFACDDYGLDCTLKTFPDANHLFQKANTGLPDEYGELPKEFVPGFVDTMVEWIKNQ